MRPRHYILPIVIMAFVFCAPCMAESDTLHVVGHVFNEQGEPMGAVIIEQAVLTNNYVLSRCDGSFCINLLPIGHRKQRLRLRFAGYAETVCDIANDSLAANLVVCMQPLADSTRINAISKPRKPYSALIFRLNYSYAGVDFDELVELQREERDLLNGIGHRVGLGFSLIIRRFDMGFDWGFAPIRNSTPNKDKQYTTARSTAFILHLGYVFPFCNNRVLLTPYAGFGHNRYTLAVIPARATPLEQYWHTTHNHLQIKQYTGLIGGKIEYIPLIFGTSKVQGIGISASAAYAFKLHRHANIHAYSTRLATNNCLHQHGLYFQVGISYRLHNKPK